MGWIKRGLALTMWKEGIIEAIGENVRVSFSVIQRLLLCMNAQEQGPNGRNIRSANCSESHPR